MSSANSKEIWLSVRRVFDNHRIALILIFCKAVCNHKRPDESAIKDT
jgi:hypothetical protein